LETFWDILERPESDQALQQIQETNINLTALKMRIKKYKLFKINSDWESRLKNSKNQIGRMSSKSVKRHTSTANEGTHEVVLEKDIQRILMSKRIFKKFTLLSEFLDKFVSFLDVDGTRLENTEKLFRKMEKFLIKSKDLYFLTIPVLFMQSIRRIIFSNKFRFSLSSRIGSSGDSDVLETLFSLSQNLSFLNQDFMDMGLSLILPPLRSDPIFLDPRVYEMVSWVFEIRLKKANLLGWGPSGLAMLLGTTEVLSRVIQKTDQKQFLSKLFDILMRMIVENPQEKEIIREIKFKGRVSHLPLESNLGTFNNYYQNNIVLGNRNYLEAKNIVNLQKTILSKFHR
jgi:hypothetical protein